MEISSAEDIVTRLKYIFLHPFVSYWNSMTPTCMLAGVVVWIFLCSKQMLLMGNYQFGREYGTAKFSNPKNVTKRLGDKEEENNRILSQSLRVSYNPSISKMNANTVIIGGPGRGKSFYVIVPNLLMCHGSLIITDTKGDLLREYGRYFEQKGYRVKSLNLCEMEKSDRYNPFRYIRKPADVSKLITNLIANTTPTEQINSADPFWERAERLYLQAIFHYVWLECPPGKKNFRSVLELLSKAEVVEGEESKLDVLMRHLSVRSPLGERHPAVSCYYKCIRGAGDTVRSIIISANSRFADFDNEELLWILDEDDMDIPFLGVGIHGDQKTKTALFVVIPDDDDTWNFVPGLLFTQITQELYNQARVFGGKLPIDVGMWLDEFCNIQLSHVDKILSTCRSRGIYMVMCIQALSQLKAIYKERYETILGCADTLVYLGSGEQSSYKMASELLGKQTLDKRSRSESYGFNGSVSASVDALGRELMTEDEVRKLPKDKCLVFLPGENPILDTKFQTQKSERFQLARDLGDYRKMASVEKKDIRDQSRAIPLDKAGLTYYYNLKEKGEAVAVFELDVESLWDLDLSEPEDKLDVSRLKELLDQQRERKELEELHYIDGKGWDLSEGTVDEWLSTYPLTDEQREEVLAGLEEGLTEKEIRLYFNPDFTPMKMNQIRRLLTWKKGKA